MGEAQNRRVVDRLIECINGRRVEAMDELFHDDAVIEWPQSGERVRGADNRRAIYGSSPQLPTITPRRIATSGDLVVAELSMDYGEVVYNGVPVFDMRDGRIARETAYWSEPFDAPEWRSK